MRLTKNIREKILRQNEGFITQTSYDSRNCSYDRTYKVQDGKVHSFCTLFSYTCIIYSVLYADKTEAD